MKFLRDLKIGTKIIVGYIILIILLVGAASMLLYNLTQLTADFSFLVEHDQPVLANAARLEKLVVDMETGERGFLITGKEEFLDPYTNGLIEFARLIEIEKDLVRDNTDQVNKLIEIENLHQEWLRVAGEPSIAMRREVNKGTVSASNLQEILKRGVGKNILDRLRSVLDTMEADFNSEGELENVILTVKIAKDMVDQETGQRGFIITGEDNFLEPYDAGQAQFIKDVAALRTRLTNDPVNMARLAQVETLAAEWHEKAAGPEINARREMNAVPVTMEDVTALIESGAGKNILDQIRIAFNEFTKVENNLNQTRVQHVEEEATLLFWGTIILIFVSIVFGLGVGVIISRAITIPLNQMIKIAKQISVGDINQSVYTSTQDEIGDLGVAFNEMIMYQQEMALVAETIAQGNLVTIVSPQSQNDVLGNAFQKMLVNLRALIEQVQDGANQVAEASTQLNAAAEQSNLAGQQVSTTIQQVAEGNSQQTDSVTEATRNVEQVARAAEGIARGAQEQANSVQKTSVLISETNDIIGHVGEVATQVTAANSKVTQAARHGVTAVAETGQGMETIRNRATIAAEKVKEMGVRSKEIGRIVDTIDDIADKTDMLALNAAVEAARAGEHGRGFAVVADQVRKLSEDSKGATRDIGGLIERVQETVNDAISAMKSTVVEVDNGSRLTKETAQSLQQILQAAEEAVTLADKISQSVSDLKEKSEGVVAASESVSAVVEENTSVAEEMAASTQEVTETMEGIASVAQENSASSEEVSASAEEMLAQVEEILASSQELSALAFNLRTATAKFKVKG